MLKFNVIVEIVIFGGYWIVSKPPQGVIFFRRGLISNALCAFEKTLRLQPDNLGK